MIVRYQHEHYDGTGFFDGLDGEKIPFLSRILAVANAFDEINSGRNPAFFCTDEEAADWLRNRSGVEFDPQVVEACLMMNEFKKFGGFPAAAKPGVRAGEMGLDGPLIGLNTIAVGKLPDQARH